MFAYLAIFFIAVKYFLIASECDTSHNKLLLQLLQEQNETSKRLAEVLENFVEQNRKTMKMLENLVSKNVITESVLPDDVHDLAHGQSERVPGRSGLMPDVCDSE